MIEQAVAALRRGGLIHLPTETVYGLGARADRADAVLKVFEAKGRPRFNPLIVHVATMELAQAIGKFDNRATQLAQAFWPGPLTLVVPIRDENAACDLARAGLDTVALRMPDHAVALAVLKGFGGGVVAPSANRSGRPSPTTQADAFEETGASVDVSLDGGSCAVGVESTVVSLVGEGHYLRAGAISRAEIEALIGPLSSTDEATHRSPGRLARHYAPEAKVLLNCQNVPEGAAYLAFGPSDYDGLVFQLSARSDVKEAARNLFSMLRAADRAKPSLIAVAPIPDHGLGAAINDRLLRASGFVG
jgi:L-threonylcarbamoyladenylate synthase